jgi:hypothetical protein
MIGVLTVRPALAANPAFIAWKQEIADDVED